MAKNVSPVPEDFLSITPHLCVRDVERAVDWYKQVFDAEETYRNTTPDGGKIIHSEVKLGDSRFFLNDEFPEQGVISPISLKGSAVTFHLYVENVDEVFQRAVDAGAEVIFPLENTFWGDRYAMFKDPFGHYWSIASRIEDLSPEEIQQRGNAYLGRD